MLVVTCLEVDFALQSIVEPFCLLVKKLELVFCRRKARMASGEEGGEEGKGMRRFEVLVGGVGDGGTGKRNRGSVVRGIEGQW